MMSDDRSYYCSMKFRFLKIDLEKYSYYNCHAAKPHNIDFGWLRTNPTQLFNTDININERQMMLSNQRNSSCEQNCWPAEDAGCASPRILQKGQSKTHTEVSTIPEIVDLTLGSSCNLTCSYCCKEFSSAWRNDILKNGDYNIVGIKDRFSACDLDKILATQSQAENRSKDEFDLIDSEFKSWKSAVKQLVITGGEPFLNKFLLDTIESSKLVEKIKIYTGLGVSIKILEKQLLALSKYTNITLIISAEGTGKFLEFNRYGTDSVEFEQKIKMIQQSGINFRFQSTLSNLTLFGFAQFYERYSKIGTEPIIISYAYQPVMLAPYVLDDRSKELIINSLQFAPVEIAEQIIQSMKNTPSDEQRIQAKQFLQQFVSRRTDLTLDIFPTHFLEWIRKT